MPAERIVSMPTAWAENAQTNIPSPPLPNTAYRDAGVSAVQIAKGQDYAALLDSSEYNEFLFRMSSMLRLLEQNGILPWSQKTDYAIGAWVMGTDGIVYKALQSSGPNNGGFIKPPDTSFWGDAALNSSFINLVAMQTTAPTGSFNNGDIYYNTASKQLFTWGSGAWSSPASPESGFLYEYNTVLYLWNGTDLIAVSGNRHPALSMLIMPCALTGVDALGWTLQGGQVTSAMSPQLYQRIVTEYNENTDIEDNFVWNNIGGVDQIATIRCRRSASTGLKIVDVANRNQVDNLFAVTGSAFYIVLDQANAVFYLPRLTDGITFTGDIDQLGVYGKDQIVNIDGAFNVPNGYSVAGNAYFAADGAFSHTGGSTGGIGNAGERGVGGRLKFDASAQTNTGDRVQGRNVKLFVYFRTGDNVINGQDIDFGGVWAALNLKANTDLNNTPAAGVTSVVVETWRSADGLSWYRKYSDGWVEQGGLVSNGGTGYALNYYIPFINPVCPIFTRIYNNASTAMGAPVVRSYTNIGAIINSVTTDSGFVWRAEGK